MMIEARFSEGVEMTLGDPGSLFAGRISIGTVATPNDGTWVIISLSTKERKVSDPPLAFHLLDAAAARSVAAGLIEMAEKAEQPQLLAGTPPPPPPEQEGEQRS